MKTANPGKKMTEITKLISEHYKLLSGDKSKEYEERYKENKSAYEKEKKYPFIF